jgi:hypothetical protein
MFSRIAVATLALACAGCATELAWPPQVQRLPEGAAGPIAAPKSGPLSSDEIVELARSGASASLIIQKMRDSRAVYSATPEQAGQLIARGVPPEVVSYMQYGEAGIAPRPPLAYPVYPYPYPTPYMYRPLAYPYGYWGPSYGGWYPGVGISFGYHRRR